MMRKIDVVGGPLGERMLRFTIGDLFILVGALREVQQELRGVELEVRMGVTNDELNELLEFFDREYRRVELETGPPFAGRPVGS
jgi:hypothetical protein